MTIQNVLWETAVEQDGYVTTLDARDAGVAVVELAKLAHRGKLRRAAHGVYRFDSLPVGRGDHYRLAVLWTGNRNTVLSHDTALDLLGLCDINPDDVHITVPKQARIRRAGRPEVVIHHEDLDVKDLAWWEGIRSVNEFTAIRQGIDTGVPVHLLREAIGTARSRGRITPADERVLTAKLDERFVS